MASEYQRGRAVDRFPDSPSSPPSTSMQPRLPRITTANASNMRRETNSISGIHGRSMTASSQVMSASFSGDFGKSTPLSAASTSNFMPPLTPQQPQASSSSAAGSNDEDYMQKYHGRSRGERTISAGHVISPWTVRQQQNVSAASVAEAAPYRRASSSLVESSSRLPDLNKTAPVLSQVQAYQQQKPENVSMIDVPETDILDSSYSEEDDDKAPQSNRERTSLSSDMTDDSEFLELCERETIVEKYDAGPDAKEVESWENPDFELYRRKDRYGFVHRDGSPTLQQSAADLKKLVHSEVRRAEKWAKMLKAWQEKQPASPKVYQRVWKGIPESVRRSAWMRLLDVKDLKEQSRTNMYRDLLMRARLVSKDVKQIDLDINRTYRDHVDFRKRYDLKQRSLFNVLAAYAMFNTEIGYCQGMSQIAALFLMYMDEEDAFWCLHSLMTSRKHLMHGFFVPGFPKLMRFQAHFEKVLQTHLPRVKKHLDKACIPPIYLTKWWFGCFLDRVPFSLALRIWDVFLLEGDSILIAMAFTIMKMHQKTIRRLEIEHFMTFVQSDLSTNFGFSNDAVMEALLANLKKLQNDRIAVPPPPGPDDLPEEPTKPLAPILTRSMIDIRMDIAEIQSRGSRANSIAMGGRSPAVMRRKTSNKLHHQSPMPSRNFSNLPRVLPPLSHQQNPIASSNLPKVDVTSSESSTPPIDPVHRRYSSEPQHHPLQQSTSNGIDESMERMKLANPPLDPSAYRQHYNPHRIQANRQSFYDNVPPPTPTSYGEKRLTTGHPSNSNNRVQHMPNNITYITVGDAYDLPPCPNGLSYHHSHVSSTPKRMDITRFSSSKEKHTMI